MIRAVGQIVFSCTKNQSSEFTGSFKELKLTSFVVVLIP